MIKILVRSKMEKNSEGLPNFSIGVSFLAPQSLKGNVNLNEAELVQPKLLREASLEANVINLFLMIFPTQTRIFMQFECKLCPL